jgi:hypothetical protein
MSGRRHYVKSRLCRDCTTAMTHIAIQEALSDKAVDWMEKIK